MSDYNRQLELRCLDCSWSEICDVLGMRAWLDSIGMLRRAVDPDAALVEELFRSRCDRFNCPECDGALKITLPVDDSWQLVECEGCGQEIPAARLAALQQTKYCVSCQEKLDRGDAVGEREFCPACGGVMEIRKASGGVMRYTMRCSDCSQ